MMTHENILEMLKTAVKGRVQQYLVDLKIPLSFAEIERFSDAAMVEVIFRTVDSVITPDFIQEMVLNGSQKKPHR